MPALHTRLQIIKWYIVLLFQIAYYLHVLNNNLSSCFLELILYLLPKKYLPIFTEFFALSTFAQKISSIYMIVKSSFTDECLLNRRHTYLPLFVTICPLIYVILHIMFWFWFKVCQDFGEICTLICTQLSFLSIIILSCHFVHYMVIKARFREPVLWDL